MCELRICRDIIDVPDLHICHVPLHVAQRFQLHIPQAVWDSIGDHIRLLGFAPTYRLATLAN